jgi:hypothetical protein
MLNSKPTLKSKLAAELSNKYHSKNPIFTLVSQLGIQYYFDLFQSRKTDSNWFNQRVFQ